MTGKSVWSRLTGSRWRHVLTLLPLGVLVGLLVGWGFDDLVFGVLVGGVFGAAFGLLFAVRNPK